MSELKMMGLREFRDGIAGIREPVRVVKTRGGVTELGVWLPHGTSFDPLADRVVHVKKTDKRAVS